MPRSGIASDRQLALPLGNHGDESTSGTGRKDAPVIQDNLWNVYWRRTTSGVRSGRFGATEALPESMG